MANEISEVVKVLEDVRREVVEARNMTIKTDNALKTLHAELKTVSGNQDAFVKRTWFSTGTAYLGFIGLCIAGVAAISNARSTAANAERERLEKQVAELNVQLEKEKTDATAAATAERAAFDTYRQMTNAPGEERLKGVDALAKLDQSKLSAFSKQVLADRAQTLRKEIGASILERGKQAFRRSDWSETIEQLSRFKAMNPANEDLLEAQYLMGNAAVQSRKFDEGVTHLTAFVDGDKRAKNRDFAMLLLVQAHDALGHREKAVEVARDAMGSYPASEFRGSFQSRLQRREQAAAAAQPGAAPAPAAAPPGPQN